MTWPTTLPRVASGASSAAKGSPRPEPPPPVAGPAPNRRKASARRSGGMPGPASRHSTVKALRAKVGAERIRTVHGVGFAAEEQP